MNEELIAKARQAASPEEIMKIAEENEIEMCKEEAESIYKQLHTSGEMSDDELESVAGGCNSTSGKTIVTCGCGCFNGQYKKIDPDDVGGGLDLRNMWYGFAGGEDNNSPCCGTCVHLKFKRGVGYCGLTG